MSSPDSFLTQYALDAAGHLLADDDVNMIEVGYTKDAQLAF